MRDALKSYLTLAAGVTDITRQRAVAATKALVNQGEATAEQVTGLAEDLLTQTRQNREAVAALVAYEVDRALGRLGLATADEVTRLTERVRDLEAAGTKAAGTQAAGTKASGGKAPAQAASAPTESTPKAPARKAPSTKAPSTKAPAARAPARKAPATPAGGAPTDAPVQQDLSSAVAAPPEPGESPA